jgi:hypothetical protein
MQAHDRGDWNATDIDGPRGPKGTCMSAAHKSEEREAAGRALYEQRQKLLEGLWMPKAPQWSELPEDIKERWRRNAE